MLAHFRLLAKVLLTASAALTASVAKAAEAKSIADIAGTIFTQIAPVGDLVVSVGMLIGVIYIVGGLLKLRQASESEGKQVRYGEGMWRLAIGTGLVGAPVLINVLTTSLGLGTPQLLSSGLF